VPDFRRDLLFLVIDTARLLRVETDKRARAHEMTRAQWGILIWLERQPGMSQKELAEFLEVEPITVARLIDRLEARGMVERRHDPKDRRIWRLHLLPPAWPVLREIDTQRREVTALLTGGMDQAQVTAMTEGLLHVKSILAQGGRQGGRQGARAARRVDPREPAPPRGIPLVATPEIA
jgi:MarR family transcriptional regulator, transcriptional regulator for hemolysin